MRGRARGAWAAAVAAVVWAIAGPAAANDAQRAMRGGEIARVGCADCHAVGVSGSSPKPEAPLFRELGRKYPVESLEEALAEGVVVGHPGMPQVKMNEADIGAFLAYLKSIQAP